jgi:hypothetical protein
MMSPARAVRCRPPACDPRRPRRAHEDGRADASAVRGSGRAVRQAFQTGEARTNPAARTTAQLAALAFGAASVANPSARRPLDTARVITTSGGANSPSLIGSFRAADDTGAGPMIRKRLSSTSGLVQIVGLGLVWRIRMELPLDGPERPSRRPQGGHRPAMQRAGVTAVSGLMMPAITLVSSRKRQAGPRAQ